MSTHPTRRCLFCHRPLPANQAVEHFPLGERVAFDPGRGRLWAVCPSCRRWNLAPFEERWEALEELERAYRDSGRVLASTENVALIRVPGVELVRVGDARLAEEAWWRYGSRMDGKLLNSLLRWRKFGAAAWRGDVRCIRCGERLTALTFKRAPRLHITQDVHLEPALHLRCARCRREGNVGEFQLEGLVAQHLLRRVVTHHHFRGASETRVRSATDYIDRVGSPDAVTRELSRTGLRLDALLARDRRAQALALEIALNEENERRLLEMELAELEARWRREEEIAAIVDGELTADLGVSRLRRGDGAGDRVSPSGPYSGSADLVAVPGSGSPTPPVP